MTLGLLLGTALSSPPGDAGPELRGPRWQGRADATAQVVHAADLRDPFPSDRAGIAAEHARDPEGMLRDPFDGRGGVAAQQEDDAPIAPASRARTRAAVPMPAASNDVEIIADPFVRTRSSAPTPAPASTGGSLRRPFGAP